MSARGLFNRQSGGAGGRTPEQRLPGAGWLRQQRAGLQKLAVTAVLLLVIYYAVTTLVAYITAPRIDMTMSPIAGPIAVMAEPAKVEPLERTVTYTGSVAPYQEVSVYPRTEGWVDAFTLYEGDRVEKDQVIARLDRVELGAKLATAKANLAQARAALEFWDKELPRLQTLHKEGAMSASEADNAANHASAARAMVQAREAEVEQISTVFSYTDVLAPIGGRVSKRHIYAGILVRPGMPIVDLQDLGRVRVQVNVADNDLPFVRRGTPATVRFPSFPEAQATRRATVTTVFPGLDPVARTAVVELVLPNPGETLRPEMYAVVDLILGRKEKALAIPSLAVYRGPEQQPLVYVTDGVVASARPVKLGIEQGSRVEVLEGVDEGEMVIWRGQRSLSDGTLVRLVTAF